MASRSPFRWTFRRNRTELRPPRKQKMLQILVVNLLLSTLIFFLAYQWLLRPQLHWLTPKQVLVPLLLLHTLRHLGLMFLMPGAIQPGMPIVFALPAAAGDFISAALALLTLVLIQRRSKFAVPLAWIFTVVGTLDFAMAITLTRITGSAQFLGAAYWIPSFWVPMLLVAHWIIFVVLLRCKRDKIAITD